MTVAVCVDNGTRLTLDLTAAVLLTSWYQKIRDIEVGIIKPENITLKTALKLAQALDCQPEDLTKPDKEESDI